MVDDISPMHHRMQKKTRSASICATGASIETVIHGMPGASGSATPEGGTPGYRRRRPATRSQSARITSGARSVRQKTKAQQQQQQQQHTLQETRSYCTSEPRLSETETPPQRRKLSQRRPQTHAHRKSNAFLDVPTMNMHHLRVNDDDEDVDRLRTFSASKGGIINRGDSFRRRRSRSNSLAPSSPMHTRNGVGGLGGVAGGGSSLGLGCGYNGGSSSNGFGNANAQENHQPVEFYRVEMLGSAGVGKQALLSQFRTSDCINAYDGPECDDAEQNVSIILNGTESELKFLTGNPESKDELEQADAFLVVYSCIDKESFTRAKQILSRLQDMDLLRHRPTILVANKIDLARSRAVSAQDGKCVACTFGAKFIEVSVGINHNCDELLAGTLTQIRLKKDQVQLQGPRDANSPAHWYKSRSVMLASMKARQMLTWILGKEDSKFKHCENLQVL
ncbi:GTP-binding protein RAD isoform X2 [Drosophila simulans]|uniref:Rad, Gem/Kir family member 3, isoform C n=3 Tax=melanogaster subgroup TaxID=32351 RepID=A8DYK6_DROME|nr:Rad, Gem/Kir family member 3, isoform F [Drosophila melanogaster]NP_001097395.1 Rad, Gem/Kir family member 3, isoform C [Drosophila melanogaster]NP_001097396.3 Rad, Gem/Kir family member 3, isoform G [Drosophila melanogaster]XP_016028862.1 GTP-binding protein RAD isoform X2 [Drosophila simulans]XP_033154446.1 GTP-binding protein RAD isoform X2 [Drosophila mauritiana]AAF46703.3 Rad, Gem/Kir family member 3, isoform F [Drosophila melanogaster]ABV53867.1 Rad, Gem/Kir family member 3, isoform |eukprot:NP_001027446.2 Rad, Gem/Kir family member 3, isoform F [Drosophila melanogaster]